MVCLSHGMPVSWSASRMVCLSHGLPLVWYACLMVCLLQSSTCLMVCHSYGMPVSWSASRNCLPVSWSASRVVYLSHRLPCRTFSMPHCPNFWVCPFHGLPFSWSALSHGPCLTVCLSHCPPVSPVRSVERLPVSSDVSWSACPKVGLFHGVSVSRFPAPVSHCLPVSWSACLMDCLSHGLTVSWSASIIRFVSLMVCLSSGQPVSGSACLMVCLFQGLDVIWFACRTVWSPVSWSVRSIRTNAYHSVGTVERPDPKGLSTF
jgi:hypothetical protein